MRKVLVCVILLTTAAFAIQPEKKITVWMIGDSTMSIKDPRAWPETGWGVPFAHFFDTTVVVSNHARNGRSTRTFLTEGLWMKVFNNIRPGDYVFIQFGHNDEVPTKAAATTPREFRENLDKYVTGTRSKGAFPVLLTSVARRKFDSTGKIIGTHDTYAAIVRAIAKEQKVPLIDMDKKSQALLQQLGPEASKLLYLWLKPGEHPNYPGGKQDDTHFNELGARMMAQLVLEDIKTTLPGLAARIREYKKSQ